MVGLFGPEVAGDTTSGRNLKTIKGYVVLNFEVTSSGCFQNIHRAYTGVAYVFSVTPKIYYEDQQN